MKARANPGPFFVLNHLSEDMDPQNHINLLLRRLISVFALADGWIDHWQSEAPESKLFNLQFNVLSQMINALSELKITTGINDVSEDDVLNAAELSSLVFNKQVNETPRKMRKVLREHLGELLWLLDEQKEQRRSASLALTRDENTDIVELGLKTYRIMSAYVQQLESLSKPLENFSSEPQRQSYPG